MPGIDASRIRLQPPPGTATEEDVVRIHEREGMLCELVDGTLVEKIMGYRESVVACALIEFLRAFVRQHKLGKVSGPDGMMRLFPGLVRIPDIAFASWSRFPGGKVSKQPVPDLVPDLAVEVLSQGNRKAEMDRKLDDYFQAGVLLVWLVDIDDRTIMVYTSRSDSNVLREGDMLTAPQLLPGFELTLSELFTDLDEEAG